MVTLLGEMASGKSTLEKMLCRECNLRRIISYTTRPIRINEINDIDYHFISTEEFEKKLGNNNFVEYTIFNNWYYGIDKSDCTDDTICITTPEGLRQLKENNDLHIVSIYIKSDNETRKIRAINRGDTELEVLRRLKADEIDFKNIKNKVDYIIENSSTLQNTFNEIINILNNERIV